jgi:hypothetical protein
MWIEENLSGRMRKRFLIVKTNNDRQYKIYIDEKTLEWFCEIKIEFFLSQIPLERSIAYFSHEETKMENEEVRIASATKHDKKFSHPLCFI